jgi:hypothetical protein
MIISNSDFIQRNVDNFIAIGTPFDGALLAHVGKLKNPLINEIGGFDISDEAYDYLSNSNGYIDTLQSKESPAGVNIQTIGYYQVENFLGKHGGDGVVSVDSSTSVKNANHNYIKNGAYFVESIYVQDYTHINMTNDPKVVNTVIKLIFRGNLSESIS